MTADAGAGAGAGVNFGWSAFEGYAPFNDDQSSPGHTPPVTSYSHDGGNCSVSGGVVARLDRYVSRLEQVGRWGVPLAVLVLDVPEPHGEAVARSHPQVVAGPRPAAEGSTRVGGSAGARLQPVA